MSNYIRYFGYFAWLILLWYIQRKAPRAVTVKERINGRTVTRYRWFFALLAIAPLVYLAATRGWFGDSGMYRKGFENAASTFSEISAYMQGVKKDKAFYFFACVWRCILGFRPAVYFGIVALIQMVLMLAGLRRYSTDLLTGLFIFVAATDYYSYVQNGMRQFVAVCIILACSKWIFERKLIPATIGVLIASQFHQSALLMIPVIFIVQGDPWNKSTLLLLIGALIAVAFVSQFTNILDNLLSETQYSNVVDDYTSWNDNGTNPIRVLVYCVPAVLSLIGLPYIREVNDPVINVCTNMSIVSAGLYLISMVTSGVFLGRLPIYVSLYANCILLPWEVDHIFTKSSASVIRTTMFILFFLFYYYQMHFTWGAV